MLAMTGVITSTTKKHSLITLLQDMEYIHGQLFERTVESGCGAVTCLPGALTMLRFSAFRRMAKYYFADKAEQCEDLFDYGKCHLGEDRWLTHLFMIGAKKRYQIQMCTSAFCKTEAVQTYQSLIKQRRRWFLGFITNEVCMLTDIRLWKMYPILCLVRFMQNTIRTTALLFFILLLAIVSTTTRPADLPVGFIAISLGLNWLMMIYFGVVLGRWKIVAYPLMFVINPFFNWYYMVYGIFTAGQRTWGGPRADAGAADENTTPQEVIEKAMAEGDELNIKVETFGAPTTAMTTRKKSKRVPLLPPDKLEGRFTAPEMQPGGWYEQVNDSGLTMVSVAPRPHGPISRDSYDSFMSARTADTSVYIPRRVESIMGEEDRKKYAIAQASQRSAGGAYMTGAYSVSNKQHGHVYEIPDDAHTPTWKGSTESFGGPAKAYELGRQESYHSDKSRDMPSPEPVSLRGSARSGNSGLIAAPAPVQTNLGRNARTGQSPLSQFSMSRSRSTTNHDADVSMYPLSERGNTVARTDQPLPPLPPSASTTRSSPGRKLQKPPPR